MKDGTSNHQMKQLLRLIQQLQINYIGFLRRFEISVSAHSIIVTIEYHTFCYFYFKDSMSIAENQKQLDDLRRYLKTETNICFEHELQVFK